MSVLEIAGYPFEELVRMAKEEPDTFEAVRANAIQAVIESVPVRRRTRLEGLQRRIDMVRQRSNSPLQACSKISNIRSITVSTSDNFPEVFCVNPAWKYIYLFKWLSKRRE